LAKILRMSVNETTPMSLPDKRAPAIAGAGTVPLDKEGCEVVVGVAGVERGDD
jgi:hypothetical protein